MPQLQIPQVLPLANLIQPLSPQVVPHEFLHLQYSSARPVNKTIWLSEVPQLLKIPLLQVDHLEASTDTETGWLWIAFTKASQVLTVLQPVILNSHCFDWHVPAWPVVGYSCAVYTPMLKGGYCVFYSNRSLWLVRNLYSQRHSLSAAAMRMSLKCLWPLYSNLTILPKQNKVQLPHTFPDFQQVPLHLLPSNQQQPHSNQSQPVRPYSLSDTYD